MTTDHASLAQKRLRLGLYGPFVALVIFAGAWSAAWLWARGEAARRMDGASIVVAQTGYGLTWTSRAFYGFPFRLDVNLTGARFSAPSGWAVEAPALKAEAFVYAPGHWVAAAPQGLVITRPSGGAVTIGARVLRASFSAAQAHPPRISLEALGVSVTPVPGAAPVLVTAAEEVHLHTRAGPANQGAVYVEIDKARARLTGLLGRIAGGKPVSFAADAIFSHASALQGADWPSAVRAWRQAGGLLNVRMMRASAGQVVVDARAGALSVGSDGRLVGSLTADIREAPRALAAMGQSGAIAPEAAGAAASVIGARSHGQIATLTIDFQAGQTTLGPAAIGPAPRVY
ncbi:MAG TPA: DUF2125 domain-containing protein [Caulobacteraceae bacterium]